MVCFSIDRFFERLYQQNCNFCPTIDAKARSGSILSQVRVCLALIFLEIRRLCLLSEKGKGLGLGVSCVRRANGSSVLVVEEILIRSPAENLALR